MDQYNYKKTLQIAKTQVENIQKIEKRIGIKNLQNKKLQELCYLRLENQEATYSELARALSEKFNTTVTKSNVNHLFIKIKNIVEEFENGKN